jgi:hypothetical protein
MKNRKFLGVVLTCALTACFGCAAHVKGTTAAPGRAGTPLENALAYNATLAQSNLAVAHLVINANNNAPPLIPTDAANTVLMAQSRIADLDRQLTPLLANAGTIGGSSPQIQQLLAEIQSAATPIVNGGDLGIKDANTQKAILTAMNGVLDAAGKVLATLQAGGLLK